MPKRSRIRKGPRMRERTRRGWRRTSLISLATNAPALMRRLASIFVRLSFPCDVGVAVHQLDEDLIEGGLVLGNVAYRAVIGFHRVDEEGRCAARILDVHAHFVARARANLYDERELRKVVDGRGGKVVGDNV